MEQNPEAPSHSHAWRRSTKAGYYCRSTSKCVRRSTIFHYGSRKRSYSIR